MGTKCVLIFSSGIFYFTMFKGLVQNRFVFTFLLLDWFSVNHKKEVFKSNQVPMTQNTFLIKFVASNHLKAPKF